MRISEAEEPSLPLEVSFHGGARLNIVYKPTSYTPIEMDRLANASRRDVGRIVHSIRDMVVSWDLTDNDGEPVSLAPPEPYEGALDPDTGLHVPVEEQLPKHYDPLWKVPSNIFLTIIKAVNAEQAPEGEN